MTIRTKPCPTCGSDFSYEIGKGKDRRHCSKECRVRAQINNRAALLAAKPPCSTSGCHGKATRVSQGLCERCYYRVRRKVPVVLKPKVYKYRYVTSGGYVKLCRPDHALADKSGNVFEHRQVAYDAALGVCPGCHWCGKELEWSAAVIDHLDEDKQNNVPSNLVVACNDCNRARGSILPFIRRMRPEAVALFCDLVRQENGAKGAGGTSKA